MHDIERHKRDQHRRAIQHILICLMVRDTALQALAVLGQPKDDPDRNQRQHEIQHIQQCLRPPDPDRLRLSVQILMEPNCEVAEAEDEKLLQADPSHVNVQPAQHRRGGEMVPGRRRRAVQLDQEGDDIQQHEVEPEAPGFDLQQARLGRVVVHHAAENHVHVRVRPEGRDEQEHEPDRVEGHGGRGVDGGDAEGVRERLPQRRHANHPAVGFAVEDPLPDVCDCGEPEEHGVEIGRAGVGTEVPEAV